MTIAKRLPFLLSDWTRLIWMSENAKAVWAPRINNINEAWSRIERWSVVEGARHSALTFFPPDYLPEATAWAASHGLVVLPLARTGVSDQYSATPKAVENNGNWQYRVVLTRPEYAKEWIEAWKDTGQPGRYAGTNNRRIGELLGFPPCCIDFFEKTWVGEGSVDTTWDMAMGTSNAVVQGSTVRVSGPPETNILLRWLGVRLVTHLPCSFDCEHTLTMARALADVGRKRHFGEWVDWIYEMLEWPVEWSALHGIAEIRTPVVTISSRTNATGNKIVVQREGTRYPEEGARGLKFPFRIQTGNVTAKPSFKRSFLPIHELNGFSAEEAMDKAHDVLLSLLPADRGDFLDLGCGTGRLLERAAAAGWKVMGIEVDGSRAGAAKIPVRRGNIMDTPLWNEHFTVVAAMPGRLLEVSTEQAAEFRAALTSRSKYVLLYAYGDWLQKYGGLGPLVAEAGLGAGDVIKTAQADGVEAALVVFPRTEVTQSNEHTESDAVIGA